MVPASNAAASMSGSCRWHGFAHVEIADLLANGRRYAIMPTANAAARQESAARVPHLPPHVFGEPAEGRRDVVR